MSELYSNGFINLDGGQTLGFFLDDSEYFVCLECRKFSEYKPGWYKNEHYKEPKELTSKSDICVMYLSKRLRQDLDRRKDENKDIKDPTDEERAATRAEMARAVKRFLEVTEKETK